MHLFAQRYLVVILAGALVGFSELLTRYRDEPFHVVRSRSAWCYMGLNGACSCLVLFLAERLAILPFEKAILAWDTKAPFDSSAYREVLAGILVAGFGGMAFLRTSLNIRSGDQKFEVGAAAVAERILSVIDQATDRERANARDRFLARLEACPFEKGKAALSTYLMNLLQSLSPEDRKQFGTNIDDLEKSTTTLSDNLRGRLLAGVLLDVGGESLLEAAIRTLGPEIGWKIRDENGAAAPGSHRTSGCMTFICSRLRSGRRASGSTNDGNSPKHRPDPGSS